MHQLSAPRAVVLAGGWAHPAEETLPSLEHLLRSRGFEVAAVTDPTNVAAAMLQPCDLLVVSACWFSMTDDRYTDDQRADYAVVADLDRRAALFAAIEMQVPILAMHTAVLSFDEWPGWSDLLGARWDWARSGHGPPEPVMVCPEPHASIAIRPFGVVDEEYLGLDISSDVEILARSVAGTPLIWLNETYTTVAVDLLGHDRRSLDDPAHQATLHQLLDHLVGERLR